MTDDVAFNFCECNDCGGSSCPLYSGRFKGIKRKPDFLLSEKRSLCSNLKGLEGASSDATGWQIPHEFLSIAKEMRYLCPLVLRQIKCE